MVPLAMILVAALRLHDTEFREAAQTATAGLISIVPEGLVLLASVTFAAGSSRNRICGSCTSASRRSARALHAAVERDHS